MEKRPQGRLTAFRAALFLALLIGLGVLTYNYGFWRSLVGLALPALVIWLGFSYFRAAGESPPETPLPEITEDTQIRFRCRMCGLIVLVEEAGSDRPPTHCREKMEVVLSAPPRPVD